MTIEEWENENFPMVWAIHMPGWDDVDMDHYGDVVLDLRTNIPDGIYNVVHLYPHCPDGVGIGCIVQDGQFDPASTASACHEAVCNGFGVALDDEDGGIDHIYIESLEWNEEKQAIELIAGS